MVLVLITMSHCGTRMLRVQDIKMCSSIVITHIITYIILYASIHLFMCLCYDISSLAIALKVFMSPMGGGSNDLLCPLYYMSDRRKRRHNIRRHKVFCTHHTCLFQVLSQVYVPIFE
jgi:hypothetical protein